MTNSSCESPNVFSWLKLGCWILKPTDSHQGQTVWTRLKHQIRANSLGTAGAFLGDSEGLRGRVSVGPLAEVERGQALVKQEIVSFQMLCSQQVLQGQSHDTLREMRLSLLKHFCCYSDPSSCFTMCKHQQSPLHDWLLSPSCMFCCFSFFTVSIVYSHSIFFL